MDIDINSAVTYEIKKIKIKNIFLGKDDVSRLIVYVPYEWLDVDDKVIRTGKDKYTQTYLEQAFQSQGYDFTDMRKALNSLFPLTGTSPSAVILFLTDTNTIAISSSIQEVDGKSKRVATKYTTERLENKLEENNITIAILKTAIQTFAQMIFT